MRPATVPTPSSRHVVFILLLLVALREDVDKKTLYLFLGDILSSSSSALAVVEIIYFLWGAKIWCVLSPHPLLPYPILEAFATCRREGSRRPSARSGRMTDILLRLCFFFFFFFFLNFNYV